MGGEPAPGNGEEAKQVQYSEFLQDVDRGAVQMVKVKRDKMSAEYSLADGGRRAVNLVTDYDTQNALLRKLTEKGVDIVVQGPNEGPEGALAALQGVAAPVTWLVLLWVLLSGLGVRSGDIPGGSLDQLSPFSVGKSPARQVKQGDVKTNFADVAGCDNAKAELMEVVDFLANTERYTRLGAKIPKGALLVGPPGTGKTLLAKAVAGEAKVPFFSISAAQFVEVYAGVGAARVRDLFDEAKKAAPCIIFIDEIDAVGRQRSAGFGQGNDEREQTVNQLLSEMDGFQSNQGVVVLAATNRLDILDKALVRPGRFDRQIQVDLPDVKGRREILEVHSKGKSIADGTDLSEVARVTPGMSGADLANLLNEAAITAARHGKGELDQDDIAAAFERISMGLEKKNPQVSEGRRRLTAYHEAGHAVLGALMSDFDAVSKISIVPRGEAGGATLFMPDEGRLETGLYTKEFLENRMCVALGGRIAEEIVNGPENVTAGAADDFQQCTRVATAMVTQLGMSETVGLRVIGHHGLELPFMGKDWMGQGDPPTSQALKARIDREVHRIVEDQHERGTRILRANVHLLDRLARMLLEQEKVTGGELTKLVHDVAQEGRLVSEFAAELPQHESLATPHVMATAAFSSDAAR